MSFALTPGLAHDLDKADLLLPEIQAETVIADKAFSAEDRVIFISKRQEKRL